MKPKYAIWYIIITKLGNRWNKVAAGKILRKCGYQRFGNGYFYLRVVNNRFAEQIVEEEADWILDHGMQGGLRFKQKILSTKLNKKMIGQYIGLLCTDIVNLPINVRVINDLGG